MAQFARPDADNGIGAWSDDASGTTNIYQAIDETTASDTDYIKSEDDPGTSVCELSLSDVSDPTSSSGHVVRYRYRRVDTGGGSAPTINLIVRLREGASTTVASTTHSGIGTSWTDGSFTLSGAEADSIIDYANLYIQFEADKTGGTRTARAEVSWAEFEVPDSGGNLRASQVFANYLTDNNPELRSSQVFANYLSDNNPELRASQVFANYLSDNNPELRASQIFANVAEFPRVFWFVPDEDVSTGSWTTGATNLWENLVYDDATFITSSLNPTLGDAFEVYIRNFVWPEPDYRVWLELRMNKVDNLGATQTDGNEIDILVELINDSTVIWSWNLNNVNGDTGLVILEADVSAAATVPVTPTEFSVKITATSDGAGSDRAIELSYLAAKSASDASDLPTASGGGGWFCCCGTGTPPDPGPGECAPCVCGTPTDVDITIAGMTNNTCSSCGNFNGIYNITLTQGLPLFPTFIYPNLNCIFGGFVVMSAGDCLDPYLNGDLILWVEVDLLAGQVRVFIWYPDGTSHPFIHQSWLGHLNPSGNDWDCAGFDHTDLEADPNNPSLFNTCNWDSTITNFSINCTP